jgi:hypothetical protein
MKYLRILFLFGLALFCGSVASHAQGFHATILDPTCNTADTQCILHSTDIGVPFSVSLDAATCGDADVTGLPSPPTPYGCFFGSNLTGGPITSFTLDFDAITGVTSCDTNIPESVSPAPAFGVTSCVVDSDGGYALTFSGGSIIPGNGFVILEEGVDPKSFVGTATADTPEPDSLLLLSTGTMMMGLYLAGRTRLFAFLKK